MALGLATLAVAVAAVRVAVPRARRHLALRAAIAALEKAPHQTGDDEVRQRLLAFEEGDAVLALIATLRACPLDDLDGCVDVSRTAIALFAATSEPLDPRPRAALEAIAAEAGAPTRRRYVAALLLEELASPRYPPEPRRFSSDASLTIPPGPVARALEAVRAAASVPIAVDTGIDLRGEVPALATTPWRALLLLASEQDLGVNVEPGGVRLTDGRADFSHEATGVSWKERGGKRVFTRWLPPGFLEQLLLPGFAFVDYDEKNVRALASVLGYRAMRRGDELVLEDALAPEVRLGRRIAALDETLGPAALLSAADALLEHDQPAAFLALLADAGPSGEPVRRRGAARWLELHAAPVPAVVAAIASASRSADDAVRLAAALLEAERRSPRFPPEPAGFAEPGARVRVSVFERRFASAIAPIASATRFAVTIASAPDPVTRISTEGTPWQCLLRMAQAANADVLVAPAEVRLVPGGPRVRWSDAVESVDDWIAEMRAALGRPIDAPRDLRIPRFGYGAARRVLDAVAALNDCDVVDRGARLELVRRR